MRRLARIIATAILILSLASGTALAAQSNGLGAGSRTLVHAGPITLEQLAEDYQSLLTELQAVKEKLKQAEETITRLTEEIESLKKETSEINEYIDDQVFDPVWLAREFGATVVGIYTFDEEGYLSGTGSGFIYSADGYIVTNNHVIADAASVTVVLSDGRSFEPEWYWGDPWSDVGFVKIAAEDLPVADWADSDTVNVGIPVAAIGTARGLQNSISTGIVSGVGRTALGIHNYPMIQVDAAINPGNSGGPVFAANGLIIGMATSKLTGDDTDNIGFVIPTNVISRIIDMIEESKGVVRPWLGIVVAESFEASMGLPTDEGLKVLGVANSQPARAAGLQKDDRIIAVNGEEVTGLVSFRMAIEQYRPGEKVTLTVKRGTRTLQIRVTLGEDSTDNPGLVPFNAENWWEGEF